MKKLTTILVIFISLVFGNCIWAHEFSISTEPVISQFVRDDPKLFFDNNRGFIVIWKDFREGEYSGYAQRFDSTGNPVGTNFPLFGHNQIAIMADSTIFSMSHQKRIEGMNMDFHIYYRGQIIKPDGTISPELDLLSGWETDCPVGFKGDYSQIFCSNDYFWALTNIDAKFYYQKFDTSGDLIFSYSSLDDWDKYNGSRLFFYGACMPNNYSVITWFKSLDESFINSIQATFIDNFDNIIQDQVVIDSLNIRFDWYSQNSTKTVVLDDEHYLFLWYDFNKNFLSYSKYNFLGEKKGPRERIFFSDTSTVGDIIDFDINVSQFYSDTIDILISTRWDDISINSRIKKTFILTFNRDGELINNSLVSEELFTLNTDNYWMLDEHTFLAPGLSGNTININKYINCIKDASIQISDDKYGANQLYPCISPLNEENVIISWKDEKGVKNQVVNLEGEHLGEVMNLNSKSFIYLNDSTCLNYSNSYIAFYRTYDWTELKKDTLTYNDYRRYCDLYSYLKFTDRVVMLVKDNSAMNYLVTYDLSGNHRVVEQISRNQYGTNIICPNDENSFWVILNKTIQLYSINLQSISSARNIEGSLKPLSSQKTGTFICKYLRDNQLCIIDTTGQFLASFPFPQLAKNNLNLQCIIIDSSAFALTWTDGKDVYAQLFNSNLEPFQEAFLIHSNPEFYQDYGNACVINDQLFCVWSDSRNPGHGYDIYGTTFDINTLTTKVNVQSDINILIKICHSDYFVRHNLPN